MLFFIMYILSFYFNSFSLLFKTTYVVSPETFRMSASFENFKEKASMWRLLLCIIPIINIIYSSMLLVFIFYFSLYHMFVLSIPAWEKLYHMLTVKPFKNK